MFVTFTVLFWGPWWSWWYGSLIYYYLCNQCLSPLTLWVQIPLRRCVLHAQFCDKVYQWLVAGQWFSPGTAISSSCKTDCQDITEILLKVVLNTITPLALVCILVTYSTESLWLMLLNSKIQQSWQDWSSYEFVPRCPPQVF